MGKLIILTGPSCVGKTPLWHALKRLHPELAGKLAPLVLYNSRSPRPGEKDGVDYRFRSRRTVASLRKKPHFVVLEVRGDLHGLDVRELERTLAQRDVIFEGNPFVGKALLANRALKAIDKVSAFMSPLSREEILFFKSLKGKVSLPELIADVMRRKLLRRAATLKGVLSLKDLEDIEVRAKSAFRELKEAYRFDFVIPNHDGEDSEHWDAFYYPVGDARKALLSFIRILQGKAPAAGEKWEKGLL
jgi:guanylate kinase